MNAMHKYHNIPTVVDNVRFASKAEARRYSELLLLVYTGDIRQLKLQPRYELLPKFKDRHGKTHQAVVYIGDFAYHEVESGLDVVEDVKGTATPVFKLKYAWMLKLYPELDFRIVKM